MESTEGYIRETRHEKTPGSIVEMTMLMMLSHTIKNNHSRATTGPALGTRPKIQSGKAYTICFSRKFRRTQ